MAHVCRLRHRPIADKAVHFRHFAPEPKEYARTRYLFEAKRHFGIVNDRLASKSRFMVGDAYSIVDMAVWGWARMVPFVLGETAWDELPHLKRLFDWISARPAAERAISLKDRHAFKTEFDAEARGFMFRHAAQAA